MLQNLAENEPSTKPDVATNSRTKKMLGPLRSLLQRRREKEKEKEKEQLVTLLSRKSKDTNTNGVKASVQHTENKNENENENENAALTSKPAEINGTTVPKARPEAHAETVKFTLKPEPVENLRPLRVVVIGAGFSGIVAAIRIPEKLRNVDLTVYEKSEAVGGVWWLNKYPGTFPNLGVCHCLGRKEEKKKLTGIGY